ncbi:hypothetical protein HD554DRAFT_2012318 [Boletus coccyginus]|nr:hypothetical protein HD554DRAFT_2012318 [Boletus coccyginus]
MLERKPYAGLTRQLVLAFDIGTTYSGISFCILQPGEIPQPQGVMRYPGQGQVGDCKVPSVMYYDSRGNLKKVGYEALRDEVAEVAMTENWVKLEWWKLHLRPKHLSSAHIKDDDIPPLPRGKSIIRVLTDFIEYLFRCAETYIQESYPRYIWLSVKDEMQFVFTHPNGWEGAQQQQIRRAIELAGLVPGTSDGRARVRFLTEGEAGLHFCIWDLFASGIPDQGKYPQGQGVVVIDAGGGTLDLSMYSMKFDPTSFEEIAPAECRLQGSVFVTRRAKGLLQRKLEGSRYSSPEMIDDITSTFDQTTKLHICNAEQPAYIKVGSLRENDPDHDIRAGKLRLSGKEATELFDGSISAVINAFEQQRNYVTMPITMAFLIGGFGASNWFWSQLQLSRPSRVYVCILSGYGRVLSTRYSHKAVPDGALSFLVDHLVKSRVARATFGTNFADSVNEENPEHLSRRETWYTSAAGHLIVPKAFRGILRKGVQANELKEFRCPFSLFGTTQSEFGVSKLSILCYRGTLLDPRWIDHSFSTLCHVCFDVREAAKTLTPRRKMSGQAGFYYGLDFDVIISFGSTEFSAQVAWKENVSRWELTPLCLF